MKIKNKWLALLALLFFILFIALGSWQLSRAQQKKHLLQTYQQRMQQPPRNLTNLFNEADWRFYRLTLTGHFDNHHTFLLDNKTFHQRVGYEVYSLFIPDRFPTPILIDRGFIPRGKDRAILPGINKVIGRVTVTGLINTPPAYVALGSMLDAKTISWPLRVEFIQLQTITQLLADTKEYGGIKKIFPYVLMLEPNQPQAYDMEWDVVVVKPEKHIGYAIQWFAFAFVLLILFVALNRRRD